MCLICHCRQVTFHYIGKNSYTVPIYKSGVKSNASNYISISKLSIIPKQSESIITKKNYPNYCLIISVLIDMDFSLKYLFSRIRSLGSKTN